MSALSFCLHLCCQHLCFSVHRRLTIVWVPSPHGSVSPQHYHHHCCVTQEQKRECQTPPTRSLSHQSPHLSSRWGCLFSGSLSTPRVLQMEDPLLPLEPTTQLPLIHLLRRHAPMARARPLSISPQQGVLLKPLTTWVFFFFLQGSAFRILLHYSAVKTLKTLTNKEETWFIPCIKIRVWGLQ